MTDRICTMIKKESGIGAPWRWTHEQAAPLITAMAEHDVQVLRREPEIAEADHIISGRDDLVSYLVLEKLQTLAILFPGAILAGGCIRDALLGNPVKDYDICIPLGTEAVASAAVALAEWAEDNSTVLHDYRGDLVGYDHFPDGGDDDPTRKLLGVFKADFGDFAIDILLLELPVGCDPVDILSTFHTPLGKFGFDGELVYLHRAAVVTFLTSIAEVTLAYISSSHYERMKQKYPSISYCYPLGLQGTGTA